MRRKFELVGFKSPESLNLTETKKYIGKSIDKIHVDNCIKFNGYGNGVNFTIKRIK